MTILDTHVLIWLDSGNSRLGGEARKSIEAAHEANELYVSAISFWEAAMLVEKGRIELGIEPRAWRRDLLSAGLRELSIDGEIGITAGNLEGFHGDPADRLITATSMLRDGLLLTADHRILGWEGNVHLQDARR